MWHRRLICFVANKDRYAAFSQIGLTSMHDIVGAENFVPVETNMAL